MPKSKPPRKKRAPLKQLKYAARIARAHLLKKGLITEESSIDRIKKEYPHIKLPGLYSYIPHKETLIRGQQGMRDLFKLWVFTNTSNGVTDTSKVDNFPLFIDFMYGEMEKIEKKAKNKERMTEKIIKDSEDIPLLGDIFAHTNLYSAAKAMKKFYVDSFAVFVWDQGQDLTTGEFAEWFFKWTNDLHDIWVKNFENEVKPNEST